MTACLSHSVLVGGNKYLVQTFSDYLKQDPKAIAKLKKYIPRRTKSFRKDLVDPYRIYPYHPYRVECTERMICYIHQELEGKGRTITEHDVIDAFERREILWLAIHGIPSRSIAFALRGKLGEYDFDEWWPVYEDEFPALEEYIEVIENFVRLSISERAMHWRQNNSAHEVKEYFVKLAKDRHEGEDLKYCGFDPETLHTAVKHALNDTGAEVCPISRKVEPTQHEQISHDVDEEEQFFLWRSVGSRVQNSRSVPRHIRELMDRCRKANNMKVWLEEELGLRKSNPEQDPGLWERNLEMELALINRTIAHITRTGIIEQSLPRPIPSLKSMDIDFISDDEDSNSEEDEDMEDYKESDDDGDEDGSVESVEGTNSDDEKSDEEMGGFEDQVVGKNQRRICTMFTGVPCSLEDIE
ncbi:hypothetical protein LTR84_009547 [Exophiala bonariae]|uniref:Uncharacterized protein n=1 Tax=Exophiala bonariae TaxID=1690606 RepID=A0AAV9MUR3_9EURO|nr:hypothetical protein LTR84_009547 [Exophiala bonariae]